jgi:hypothetical protein
MKLLTLFFARIGLTWRESRPDRVSPVDGIVRLFKTMPGRPSSFGTVVGEKRVR